MGKIGTDHLKKLLAVIIALVNQGITSFKDGVQTSDFFAFLDEFMAVPDAIKNAKDAIAELRDLDSVERADLNTYVEETLQIPKAEVEAVVIKALDAVESVIALIEALQALKASKTASANQSDAPAGS